MEQKQEVKEANNWFKLHDIQSFIYDNTVYIVAGQGFEVQISTAEIAYRAQLYRDNNNLKH